MGRTIKTGPSTRLGKQELEKKKLQESQQEENTKQNSEPSVFHLAMQYIGNNTNISSCQKLEKNDLDGFPNLEELYDCFSLQNAEKSDKVNKVGSRFTRAGLRFPVKRIHRSLCEGKYADQIDKDAPVFLTAVIEYLATKVLELAGNGARNNINRKPWLDDKKFQINPSHLQHAIKNDKELKQLVNFKNLQEKSKTVRENKSKNNAPEDPIKDKIISKCISQCPSTVLQPVLQPQTPSFNNWESVNLENDKATEKFRRLMGIKEDESKQESTARNCFSASTSESSKLFDNQGAQFEKARVITHKKKGFGLGF